MPLTPMDLSEADLRIFQAKRELAKQRERVERFLDHGELEKSARAMLTSLEATLTELIVYRDKIANELQGRR